MYKKFFFVLFIGFYQVAAAQKVVAFTSGLFTNGMHRYGREALYSDTLAYLLYNQMLPKPEAGKQVAESIAQPAITWKEVQADSANLFRTRRLGWGGYLYLTHTAAKEENVLLNITGNSAVYFNGALHAGDPYRAGWLYIPVKLKKGLNELYVRVAGQVAASLVFPEKTLMISTADSTMPYVVLNKQNRVLQGAVVIINSATNNQSQYQVKTVVSGKTMVTAIPTITAMSARKVIVDLDAGGIAAVGKYECRLTLMKDNKTFDEKLVMVEAVDSSAKYSNTFVSAIDGSLQYYSVTPQLNGTKENAALFLSVHGAGVEAIGQAKAYQSKDWGTLVAATNRRPRGFNWEDWGRLDALEVLSLAKAQFKPDPQRIYLTGHSMGGHGTWFLGATYPGNWAGIGPCSGYPTLKEYGSADGKIPDSSINDFEQLLLRAGNQSDVIKLADNYKPLGIYILHGDSDKVVSVKYARQMKKLLSDFHTDFSYYEYPGGEHWFGDQSVDWPPLFNFLKWHARLADSAVNEIDFTTSSPGISSTYRWASVIQQEHPLAYSHLRLQRSLKTNSIRGTTQNVQLLKLALDQFAPNSSLSIELDGMKPLLYTIKTPHDSLYISKKSGEWMIGNKPGDHEKLPGRYGTFKEAFNNRMIFVYGTTGNKEENEWSLAKARYDAEAWYYRGNGAVDIITDKEFSLSKYKDRGIVLYGNKSSNSAWEQLLAGCPIQVDRNIIKAGDKTWTGDDLAAYFTWPAPNSLVSSVAVITGTGLKGMRSADANQYFAGGSGFPDFMIFRTAMLISGPEQIQMAGFFNNEWKLDSKEFRQR